MKKKWITGMAMLMAATLLMGACGGVAQTPEQTTAASTTPAAATSAPAATASAEAEAEPEKEIKKTFTLWASGSDNVRQQFEAQMDQFNRTNQDGFTGTLQFITSGTGAQGLRERIVAAKLAGQTNTDYDLVEMGGDEVLRYLTEGGEDVILPIDKTRIPNLSDLQFPATFRDDLVVPYRGTTVVLAYNEDVVPNPPKTTEELYTWIRNNPGRFAYNTPDSGGSGSSFVFTTVYNNLPKEAMTSTDETWMAQWDEGFDLLSSLHPYMYKSGGRVVYPNKNQGAIDLLANLEVDMIPAWADMIISQSRMGTLPASVKVSQLSPAFTGNTVVLGIPSIGSSPDAAYAFINYMLSPAAQNLALDNMAAIPVIRFDKLDPALTGIISNLNIDAFRIGSIGALGTELNERWTVEISTMN